MKEKSANILWILIGLIVGLLAGCFLTAPVAKAPAEVVVSENITSEEAVNTEEIVVDNGEIDISNDMIDTVGGLDPRPITTLQGRAVCLPPKGATDTLALECALGLEAVSGDFYALDLADRSPEGPEDLLAVQNEIQVSGYLTPVELLSTDRWMKYDIEGIVSVTEVMEM